MHSLMRYLLHYPRGFHVARKKESRWHLTPAELATGTWAARFCGRTSADTETDSSNGSRRGCIPNDASTRQLLILCHIKSINLTQQLLTHLHLMCFPCLISALSFWQDRGRVLGGVSLTTGLIRERTHSNCEITAGLLRKPLFSQSHQLSIGVLAGQRQRTHSHC